MIKTIFVHLPCIVLKIDLSEHDKNNLCSSSIDVSISPIKHLIDKAFNAEETFNLLRKSEQLCVCMC